LLGYGGDDFLDGGLDDDSMAGGDGDDGYVVDPHADTVVEGAAAGIDWVYTTVGYTLGANVENLALFGGAVGKGNELDNHLRAQSPTMSSCTGTRAATPCSAATATTSSTAAP